MFPQGSPERAAVSDTVTPFVYSHDRQRSICQQLSKRPEVGSLHHDDQVQLLGLFAYKRQKLGVGHVLKS